MPISRAAAAPPTRSVGASAARSTSTGRSAAISRKPAERVDLGAVALGLGQRRLERAVAAQDVGRPLLADPLGARQPVRGIAA